NRDADTASTKNEYATVQTGTETARESHSSHEITKRKHPLNNVPVPRPFPETISGEKWEIEKDIIPEDAQLHVLIPAGINTIELEELKPDGSILRVRHPNRTGKSLGQFALEKANFGNNRRLVFRPEHASP